MGRHRFDSWPSSKSWLQVSEPSACFPQIYPSVLEHEVQDIIMGRIVSSAMQWWYFLSQKAQPLMISVEALELLWWFAAPASVRDLTKVLAYTGLEWLFPLT